MLGAVAFPFFAWPAAAEQVSIESSAPAPGDVEAIAAALRLPEADGPHPAVIIMHGCSGLTGPVQDGVDLHADALVDSGFAVLVLDSFRPRGLHGGAVCESIPLLAQARIYRTYDAFDALRFLEGMDGIDANHVFLIGQSNGGSVALLSAVKRDWRPSTGEETFRAIVAYYPWCGTYGDIYVELVSDLLVMVGENDGWTPAAICEAALPRLRGASAELVVYDGAYHSFDLPIAVQTYAGQTVGGDPAAARDSRLRQILFFKARVADAARGRMPLGMIEVQHILKGQGHDPGLIDGVWGARTLEALNALRADHDKPPVSSLDADSIAFLRSLQEF